MRANINYLNKTPQFWGYVRVISEKLGYSDRNSRLLKTFMKEEAHEKLLNLGIIIQDDLLTDVIDYLNYRANILNNDVQHNLMSLVEAKSLFEQLQKIHNSNFYTCKLPLNKQKNEKRDYAFFTGIINILTEQYFIDFSQRKNLTFGTELTFDHDPKNLTYITNSNNELLGTLSRRFDGAFPSTVNPSAIWEIKEYYYTTSFGSRIADGVYETQLDGYEINELSHFTDKRIKHIYFIDAYNTWWLKGKSYLCRIIDMLHIGLVDEVIVGKEVISRWPEVLESILTEYLDDKKILK